MSIAQLDLFKGARLATPRRKRARPLARRTDPRTSHEAANGLKVTLLESAVLEDLRRFGPATSEQLAARLNLDRVTVSPRTRPLADKGLIEDSGERRKGASGRLGIIWRAK